MDDQSSAEEIGLTAVHDPRRVLPDSSDEAAAAHDGVCSERILEPFLGSLLTGASAHYPSAVHTVLFQLQLLPVAQQEEGRAEELDRR